MKKSRYFIYGCLLTVSIFLVIFAFELADLTRGYCATGGEVFTIALPLLIFKWRLWTVEQNKKKHSQKKKITYKKCTQ